MSASCCGTARKNTALIILSTLVIAVAVWVIQFTKQAPEIAPPPVETIEVLVAAKDLALWTEFTKDNVDELIQFGRVPKASVPSEAKHINTKGELIGKQATRAYRQGEILNALREIESIMSIPLTAAPGNGVFIGPGSRVDILVSYVEGGTDSQVFTLLPDMIVLSVDAISDLTKEAGHEVPVAFAVNQKQALLITLANQANCNLAAQQCHPDAPKREFDYDKTLARVLQLVEKRESRIAPAPRVKGEQ